MNPEVHHEVLGYRVAALSLEQAADWAYARCRADEPAALLVTLNPEIIVQAAKDRALEAALKQAQLTVADGVGVLWAARRSGAALPGRVPGVELSTLLLEKGGKDLRVYFLGARPGVAERAATAAARTYGVQVAGYRHGYFDRATEAGAVAAEVAASGAHLLLAGLGEGQELFLANHLQEMNIRLAIGVGGTLDVLAGEVQRTPEWTRRLGVEWLWRVGLDRKRWHRFPRLLRFMRLVLSRTRS